MAELSIGIGGRDYIVACRDGEEAHLRQLAAMVDDMAKQAQQSMGMLSEVRMLLFAALLLADALNDARQGKQPAPVPTSDPQEREALADLVDALARRLEAVAGA